MRFHIWVLSIALSILLCSCSSNDDSDNSTLVKNVVTELSIVDLGNDNNSSDIIVLLDSQVDPTITEIVLFVTSPNEVVDKEDLMTLNTNNSVAISASMTEQDVVFPPGLTDLNGSTIQNGSEYVLRIALRGTADVFLDSQQSSFTLSTESHYNGRYKGVWSDNIYTGAVTAELNSDLGLLRGKFWYTGNYISCCDGPDADDGIISFDVMDQTIPEFSYSQRVEQYNNNGACNGEYNGSGSIDRYITLSVTLSGEDCDGVHQGSLFLTKVSEEE